MTAGTRNHSRVKSNLAHLARLTSLVSLAFSCSQSTQIQPGTSGGTAGSHGGGGAGGGGLATGGSMANGGSTSTP
jgi:hypothetical protein